MFWSTAEAAIEGKALLEVGMAGLLRKVKEAIAETLDDEEFPNSPEASRIAHTAGLGLHDDVSQAAQLEAKARHHAAEEPGG